MALESSPSALIEKPKSFIRNIAGGFSRRISDVLKSTVDRGVPTAVNSGLLGLGLGAGLGILTGGASIIPTAIATGIASLKLGALVGGVIGAVEGVMGEKFFSRKK